MIQEWAAVHECLGFPHQVFAEQEFRADEVPGVEPALRPRPDGAGHQVIGIAHPMNAGSPRRWVGTEAAAPASVLRESSVAAAAPRPAPFQSPEVQPDGKVTFRLQAPDSRKVELSGQFLKGNQPMEKNEAGLWRITVGPVEPNLFTYNFVVDGVGLAGDLLRR